jgi:magnesium transporter|tara:strand:+ start:51 stop:446 length:396 start_codon:yes stop_codon:yes gene_type:complete
MDNRHYERLREKITQFEDDIFSGKDVDLKEFYLLKRTLVDNKEDNQDLFELFLLLEAMIDKSNNELMNKRLNLLTIWSTIFLPLSFYTGLWGMNFDDIPFLTGDHGFWIFCGLTGVTIIGMLLYFKKHKWL